MKPASLLFAGSVAANAVFAWLILSRPVASPTPTTQVSSPMALVPAYAPVVTDRLAPVDAWHALRHDDLATFAANLRAAGLSDALVRAIVGAEIDERFRARERALAPKRPPLNYWQYDTYREPLETRLARLDLKREKARMRVDLLGPEPATSDDDPLPAAQRELARMITEDYDAMIGDFKSGPFGMTLPAERARYEALQAEQRRELESLFTPAELAEYEFRVSWNMQQLRRELANFDATEQEFRTIYSLQDEVRRQYDHIGEIGPRDGERNADFGKRMQQAATEREAAKQAMNEKIRSALGDERYDSYRRETDNEMIQLRVLVSRSGIPQDAAVRMYELRDSVVNEAARIGDDTTMSDDARRAMLRELAGKVRTGATSLLGPDAAQAYLGHASFWLRMMEDGLVVSFDGSGTSGRGMKTAPASQP